MKQFALLWLAAAALPAHHSTTPFDMVTPTTVKGTVVQFRWANPHSYIYMDVKENGKTHRWTLEAEALNLLRRFGWTKDTLKPGDEITCLGGRAKDPDTYAMKCFTITFADGRKLQATPLSPPK